MIAALVDFALVLALLEAPALALWRRATGSGPAVAPLLANLASGACLLAGLRLALSGAAGLWVALALTGALLAHLADLTRRWRRG